MRAKGYVQVLIFTLAAGFSACEQEMRIEIPDPDELIVVDGWIENERFAKVLLTKTAPYFSVIDSAALQSHILTRAKVTMSDGDKEEVLILRNNPDYFPPFMYEGNEIIGEVGKTYTLRVEYGGKSAEAITTIPPPVPLDTLFFELEPGSDSLGTIYLEFSDPPGIKNYYRVLTQRYGKDSRHYSTMIMCLDDFYFNGERFGFSVSNGPETFLASYGNDYFQRGDTVSIKFCSMDSIHFNFWNTLQEETFNAVNPFATSLSEVETNIEGQGIGVWGGYGVSRYLLVID